MSWVGRPGRVWVPAGAGVLALAAAVCQVPVGRSGLGSALSAKACRPGAQHASGTVDGKTSVTRRLQPVGVDAETGDGAVWLPIGANRVSLARIPTS